MRVKVMCTGIQPVRIDISGLDCSLSLPSYSLCFSSPSFLYNTLSAALTSHSIFFCFLPQHLYKHHSKPSYSVTLVTVTVAVAVTGRDENLSPT